MAKYPSNYVKGALVGAQDYNDLAGVTGTAATDAVVASEKAGYLWGVGYGDRGYGQSTPALTAHSAGSLVPAWANLREALLRLTTWQDTSDDDLPPSTALAAGAPIAALTRGYILRNHDFQTGVLTPWTSTNSSDQTWSVVSGADHNGTTKSLLQSVAIAGAASQGRFVNPVIPHSVGSGLSLPGKTIRARGWAKRVAGNGQAQLVVIYRNNSTLNGATSTVFTTSSDWTLLEVTGTVPADTTRIDFEFRNPGGSEETTSQFDDAQFFLESSAQSIPDLLALLDENRLNYDIANMTLASSAASSTRSTAWSNTITCEFSVTFASENAARYFHNTGGEIRIALEHPSTATSQDQNWHDVLDDLVVAFRANESVRLSGSTGTATGVGYYDLTTSYQTILDGTNSGSGAYSTNDYLVEAKADTITGLNGAKGSEIWFRVTLADQHANVHFDEVSSGTNAVLSHLRATATGSDLLTSAIAAPSCAVETDFDD
jgi:hypothetical protein